MPAERYARVSCSLCGKVLRTRKGKPRTQKQWRVALLAHLILSPEHDMKPEEAKRVVDSVSST
jgi:hypothetical protein